MAQWLIDGIAQSEKPWVPLAGEDGNVFAIIGRVHRAWRKQGRRDVAQEYLDRATDAECYNEALSITLDYINEGRKSEEEE